MTNENRRTNIQDELARAAQALRAAEALAQLDLSADSVSRAYYAVFHALRALLLSAGLEPKSHQGAIHLFNTGFVKPGTFATSHNRLIAGLQRARELADYDSSVQFSKEDALIELQEAKSFVDEVERYLREAGWAE